MTLTTRLTLFFLTALAVVLAAFSLTLYILTQSHLLAHLDSRIVSKLDTLVAATELEPDGLEWDRKERTLWPEKLDEPTIWAIYDSHGHVVDGEPSNPTWLDLIAASFVRDAKVSDFGPSPENDWRVLGRTFSHPATDIVERRPKPGGNRIPGDERYQTLRLIVATSMVSTYSTLRTLAWTLLSVSVAVWLVAAAAGRWFCRRALAPLARISSMTKRITADDLSVRLAVPPTDDEIAELATAFNDLLTRLQESFERQRRFAGEASHQLRTPLTAMLGQLEVALRRERSADEYCRVIGASVIQANRLREIIESLLFLAKIDADAEVPRVEATEIRSWVQEHVTTAWQHHSRFHDIAIEVSGSGELSIQINRSLLAQALDNLIDNALKYSATGSPVRIEVGRSESTVTIAVRDEGLGIATAELGGVFTPFVRGDDARRRGVAGLGLGLAVAARIVQLHKGDIEVCSRVKRGSTFTCRLPLDQTRRGPNVRIAESFLL